MTRAPLRWLLLLWSVGPQRGRAAGEAPEMSSELAKPEASGTVVHYAYLDQYEQKSDGLGGHILRAFPPLDFALAMGLRIVCNPDIFFNGKSDDPVLFSTLVGCVDRTNPNLTQEHLNWAALTDWVEPNSVRELPRVNVRLCKLPGVVKKYRNNGSSPIVFVLHVAGSEDSMGMNAGPWLRKQYHIVRQERQRLAALQSEQGATGADPLAIDGEAMWGNTPPGHRILLHYRTGMWSLMPIHKHGPPHFATYYEVADHILRKLEGIGAISQEGSEGARLILMAIWIEDEQAIERTEYELGLFAQRYPTAAMKLFSEKSHARRPERLIRDLDLMTTADYLMTAVSQWGTSAKMLQRDAGVHIGIQGHMRLQLNNSIVVNADGSLPSREEARAASWKPLGPADLRQFCQSRPNFAQREEKIGKGRSEPPPDYDDFKRRQLRFIADRDYRGPKLPKEKDRNVKWEVRLGSDPWPAEPLCKTCVYDESGTSQQPEELTADEIDEDDEVATTSADGKREEL